MTASIAIPPQTLHRHRAISIAASLVAFNAYSGAVGLATGVVEMGHERNSRLPLTSPTVGACALAIFVALPFTVLAVQAWGGSRRTGTAAYEAGLALVVWVLVEVAFIREVSFLQPLFVVVGSMFCLAGRASEHFHEHRARSHA